MSNRWKELVVLLGLMVCFGLLWLLRAESHAQLRQLQDRVQTNQAQINQLQMTLNQTPALTTAEIQQAKSRLPSTMDVPTVLREISSLAHSAGVTVSTFQFSPSPAGPSNAAASSNNSSTVTSNQSAELANLQALGLQAYPINVTVNGSMREVLWFMNGLQHSPRLTVVQSVMWQSFRGQAQVGILFNVFVDPSPVSP